MVPVSTTADSLAYDISGELIIDIPSLVLEPPQWADKCCIYRVPQRLRLVNKDAYTPKLI